MASVTVVISVHRRVPPYPVVVLLPVSLSLFCYYTTNVKNMHLHQDSNLIVTTCLLMASVTVIISVHRRVPSYPVVVLLPTSLSLFCYCYYMLTDGFCHCCNICTQKSPSLPCSCPSTSQSVLVLLLLLHDY